MGFPDKVAELGLSNSENSDRWEDNIERVRIGQDKDIDGLKALKCSGSSIYKLTGRLIINQ